MTLAAFHNVHPSDLDHIVSIDKHIIEEDLINFYCKNEPEFIRRFEKKQRDIFETVSEFHRLKSVHPEYCLYPTPFGTLENSEGSGV